MTRKSLTKTVATVLTAALVAGSMLAPAPASAKDHRKAKFAIGALVGIGGALLGAAIANGQSRHADQGYNPQRPVGFVDGDEEEDCFEKPVKRFDRFRGEPVIVGYKTVCR